MSRQHDLILERVYYRYLCVDIGIEEARKQAPTMSIFMGKGITKNDLIQWEHNIERLKKSRLQMEDDADSGIFNNPKSASG